MSMPLVVRSGIGAIWLLIFSCPTLVIRGVTDPWHPFGPQGKERGDQTLTRSYPTGAIPIRPLSPSAGCNPPMVTHCPGKTGEVIRQARSLEAEGRKA